MMRSAVRDSPTLASFCVDLLGADLHAARTRRRDDEASQPKTAVFQWFALQRPMRPARFRCRLRGRFSCGSF